MGLYDHFIAMNNRHVSQTQQSIIVCLDDRFPPPGAMTTAEQDTNVTVFVHTSARGVLYLRKRI